MQRPCQPTLSARDDEIQAGVVARRLLEARDSADHTLASPSRLVTPSAAQIATKYAGHSARGRRISTETVTPAAGQNTMPVVLSPNDVSRSTSL